MAEQSRNSEVGVQRAHAIFGQLPVFLRGIGMAKAMKGQRSAVARILNLRAMLEKEKLSALRGP